MSNTDVGTGSWANTPPSAPPVQQPTGSAYRPPGPLSWNVNNPFSFPTPGALPNVGGGDNYIPSDQTRPHGEWGEPDYFLRQMQSYPGMPTGPGIPSVAQIPQMMHANVMGLGQYGSPGVAGPMIQAGMDYNQYTKSFMAGQKARMDLDWERYIHNLEIGANRQNEENRAYGEAFAAYGPKTDPKTGETKYGDEYNKATFEQRIREIAQSQPGGPDTVMLNTLDSGDMGAVERLIQYRDAKAQEAFKQLELERKQKAGAGEPDPSIWERDQPKKSQTPPGSGRPPPSGTASDTPTSPVPPEAATRATAQEDTAPERPGMRAMAQLSPQEMAQAAQPTGQRGAQLAQLGPGTPMDDTPQPPSAAQKAKDMGKPQGPSSINTNVNPPRDYSWAAGEGSTAGFHLLPKAAAEAEDYALGSEIGGASATQPMKLAGHGLITALNDVTNNPNLSVQQKYERYKALSPRFANQVWRIAIYNDPIPGSGWANRLLPQTQEAMADAALALNKNWTDKSYYASLGYGFSRTGHPGLQQMQETAIDHMPDSIERIVRDTEAINQWEARHGTPNRTSIGTAYDQMMMRANGNRPGDELWSKLRNDVAAFLGPLATQSAGAFRAGEFRALLDRTGTEANTTQRILGALQSEVEQMRTIYRGNNAQFQKITQVNDQRDWHDMFNYNKESDDRLAAFTHMNVHNYTLDPKYSYVHPGTEMGRYYGKPVPQGAHVFWGSDGYRWYKMPGQPDSTAKRYTGPGLE